MQGPGPTAGARRYLTCEAAFEPREVARMAEKPVLVIADDDPNVGRILGYRLERMGMEVHVTEDGGEALELISRLRPDAVVLDVMMPVMNGFEVLRSMRLDPQTRGIPAILLSARAAEGDIRKGEDLGASGYMTKPFSPGELAERINALLDGKAL